MEGVKQRSAARQGGSGAESGFVLDGGTIPSSPCDDEVRKAAAGGRHLAEALDALRAWLLLEDSYARGGVPDEVLHFIHDHISRLLGPRAHAVASDVPRKHIEAGGDLAGLARDRSALLDLLTTIEGKRRPDPAHLWVAHAPLSGETLSSLQKPEGRDAEGGYSGPWRPHGHPADQDVSAPRTSILCGMARRRHRWARPGRLLAR